MSQGNVIVKPEITSVIAVGQQGPPGPQGAPASEENIDAAITTHEEKTDGSAHEISGINQLQQGLDAKLVKASNLSDLADVPTARTNVGLGNVDNTSDLSKPISTLVQTALDLKAPLSNPRVPVVHKTAAISISSAVDVIVPDLPASGYLITKVRFYNPSSPLTISTARMSLRTAASGGGTALVSSFLLSGLSNSTKIAEATLEAAAADKQTSTSLYFRATPDEELFGATISALLEYVLL